MCVQASHTQQYTYADDEDEAPMNSLSYLPMSKLRKDRWDDTDTELFYSCLSQFGTDFTLMSSMFQGRTRKQVRTLPLPHRCAHARHTVSHSVACTQTGRRGGSAVCGAPSCSCPSGKPRVLRPCVGTLQGCQNTYRLLMRVCERWSALSAHAWLHDRLLLGLIQQRRHLSECRPVRVHPARRGALTAVLLQCPLALWCPH